MTKFDLNKSYNKYAKEVSDGKIVACENIILACKRYISWFDRDDIYFDYADVDKKIKLVSKMKHSTGKSNGKQFTLLPWQQWIFAATFGFKWCQNNLRVTEHTILFCARKQGKTSLAAAIGLIMAICDGEASPEIEFVASSRQQASIGFEATKNYAESLDPKNKVFHKYRNEIRVPINKGKIFVLSSDALSLDGYNSSFFILDEAENQKTSMLYDVLVSSQGMREQPLSLIITTAGFLLNGYFLYEMCKINIDILKGLKDDDTTFCALYSLDEGDDYTDESVWIKSNPSLDKTVTRKYLRGQVQQAQNNSTLQSSVLTKNFNLWVQSQNTWIPQKYRDNIYAHVDLTEFKDETCYVGVDLSSVSDLTDYTIMIPPNPSRTIWPDKFIFKNYVFVPETALQESPNSEMYSQWVRSGELLKTSGNVVDYEEIMSSLLASTQPLQVWQVLYDSWNAASFATDGIAHNLPMTPFSQALGNFNNATKMFEILIRQGKVIIDKNSLVNWCFDNVELKHDSNDNVKPIKAGNVITKKIDPIIGMLESLGGYLKETNYDSEVIFLENK